MLIGIDGIPVTDHKTGVGHYTFELAKSLALASPTDQVEIISPFSVSLDAPEQVAVPPNLRVAQVKVNYLERNWWALGLPRYIKRSSLSLFHGTNYDIPLGKRCPTVLTIHDLSPFYYPETHPSAHVRRARRRVPFMLRMATRVVTHSEDTRKGVIDRFGIAPDKVTAVPAAPRSIFRRLPAAQTAEVRQRLGIEDDFLLFVGTIEPRKNLITLLRAYRELLKVRQLVPQLVIAGKKGWLTDELFHYVQEAGLVGRVRFTGYLSDGDLCALYSSCRVFIYPSLYEGFGLPPLEAMACGAPVIVGAVPSINEAVNDAAVKVAPDQVDNLAQKILILVNSEAERQKLSEAGIKRARGFTWERTAQLMLEVYQDACDRYAQQPRQAISRYFFRAS